MDTELEKQLRDRISELYSANSKLRAEIKRLDEEVVLGCTRVVKLNTQVKELSEEIDGITEGRSVMA